MDLLTLFFHGYTCVKKKQPHELSLLSRRVNEVQIIKHCKLITDMLMFFFPFYNHFENALFVKAIDMRQLWEAYSFVV